MNGTEIRNARLASSWTQSDAAIKLGLTQAYLSMLERGTRPVTDAVAMRVFEVLEVPATALPLRHALSSPSMPRDPFSFKEALGSLGYPGFAYMGGSVKMNPAELLLEALDSEDLDPRVVEALPWLPLNFPDLNWDWLVSQAKLRDRQNRLAFVVDLACQLAAKRGDAVLAEALAGRVNRLERSRLAGEDTLCEASMTRAERAWLTTHRSQAAVHWNLLSDLSVEQLHYFAF